jgi:hypothetical protein
MGACRWHRVQSASASNQVSSLSIRVKRRPHELQILMGIDGILGILGHLSCDQSAGVADLDVDRTLRSSGFEATIRGRYYLAG